MLKAVIPALSIRVGDQEIFAVTEHGMVLAPTEESERTAVFLSLTDALAILAGVKLPSSSDATASAANYLQQNQQCRDESRKRGDVVPLRAHKDTGI